MCLSNISNAYWTQVDKKKTKYTPSTTGGDDALLIEK